MSCEFCDKEICSGFCIPLGKGSVSFGIDYGAFEKPMFCFELSIPSAETATKLAHVDVEVCPVCGAKVVDK